MKRSHMWGIIAGVWMATNLGILVYWGSQFDVATFEYKWYPFYGFLAGFIPIGIAGYYSHYKEGDKFDWDRAFDE